VVDEGVAQRALPLPIPRATADEKAAIVLSSTLTDRASWRMVTRIRDPRSARSVRLRALSSLRRASSAGLHAQTILSDALPSLAACRQPRSPVVYQGWILPRLMTIVRLAVCRLSPMPRLPCSFNAITLGSREPGESWRAMCSMCFIAQQA